MKNDMTMKLGITGGIGSGKTYVAHRMEQRGIPVYYTDDEAKRLMNTDEGIRKALVRLIGEDAYLPDGRVNKAVVAAYLFSDSSHVEQVNGIVHPVVREDFGRWVIRQSSPLVAMECAILFESGFDKLVDIVLAVCASEDVRLKRAMHRDGATERQVLGRMAAQWTDEERRARAHYIIRNEGDTDIDMEIDALLQRLSPDFRRND